MSSSAAGSVTRWIGALKAGDPTAVQRLWQRYYSDLVRLARKKLKARNRAHACEDEEDAALSAFYSLCIGAVRGRFDRLNDREDLRQLLAVITVRKALDQVQRQRQRKRGGGRIVGEASLAGPDPEAPGGLEQLVARGPTPALAAALAEDIRRRLDGLGDPTLRQVALWRMEGYSNDEIADRLGCVTRTVERKLDLIRKAWLKEGS